MLRSRRWLRSGLLVALLSVAMLLVSFGSAPKAAAGSGKVQLIADDDEARSGDRLRFHLLYYNTEGKDLEKVKLKIKLPHGAIKGDDDDDRDDRERDEEEGVRTWTLLNVKANQVVVIHFTLLVTDQVTLGSRLDIDCSIEVNGVVDGSRAKVTIPVGTSIHQPFFVGYPDGGFHPTAFLTRAEAAAVVARVKQLAAPTTAVRTFADAPSSHWAHSYINKVVAAGYMEGDGDRFYPDSPISRGELVALVLRLRGVGPLPFPGFEDAREHWAKDHIATARALRWIDGMEHGRFAPAAPIERQAAAKLLAIALFRHQLVDGEIPVVQHFPDVPRNRWSFGWVEEVSKVAHESRRGARGELLIRYLPEQTNPF